MSIFGRRAAIYSIDQVVTTGTPLDGYEFNCTSSCGIDCDLLRFEANGSEAAIAELTMCGTLMGKNVSYMENHTLSKWIERIKREGDFLHYNVSMDIENMTVLMYDAWSFAVITNTDLGIDDKQALIARIKDRRFGRLTEKLLAKRREKRTEDKEIVEGEVVETSIDKLFNLIDKRNKVKINENLAKELGVSKQRIEEWAVILEEHNLVTINYPPLGEPEITRKERK